MRRRRLLTTLAPAALLAAAPGLRAQVQAQPQPTAARRTLPLPGGRALPPVGLGTWLTFDVGDDVEARNRCREVLRRFFAAGGGMIDSSPMYGQAERLLGELLPSVGHRDRLVAATKVWTPLGPLGPGQLERSQQLWGVPRFDVLLVHNLLNWRDHLKTLRRAKDDGRVLRIGVSTSHGSRHDAAEQVLRNEPIDVLQITWNLADQRAEALLDLAAERGVTVVVNRPFDGGHLFDRVRGRPLPGWAAAEVGCADWAAFFLKWVIGHPAVGCAIPATGDPAHLEQNMAAGRGALPDASTRRRMLAFVTGLS